MTNKILELTEKIYEEGVAKAKVEATQIIKNAKNEVEKIIDSAKKQESEIIENAKKKAEEYKRNVDSEVQLAARQFLSNFKLQITKLVSTAQVEPPIQEAFKDDNFIKDIILTLIKNWNPQNPEESKLNILLPKKDEKSFTEFFENRAITSLNGGLNIQFDANTTKGFKIGPKDGSYVISFSNKDFENYFKLYIKDKTKNLLFESKSA